MEREMARALFADEADDIRSIVASIVNRRRVVGVEANGYYRTVSLDPVVTGELTFPALKGMPINIGDDVLLLRVGGGEVIIGALPS